MTKAVFGPLSQRVVRSWSKSSSAVPEQFAEICGASLANAIACSDAAPANQSLIASVRTLVGWTADWVGTASKYYAAAAQYEQLSKLSDAELRRRGLCRSNLAQDLINAQTRPKRTSS
jgi:hypothetical protein